MALRGDLASVDLAQVFQMLALNRKVGLLSIQSARLWKVLYFDHRGVTVHHNVHAVLDRVVAAFVRNARLTQEAVDEVRDHAVRMGQPLADSLLAGGYVDPLELEDQYRIELEEELYDLFFCRDAKFEFHENATDIPGRDATIDERFFSNCDSVVMEAARRIDEWTYISERVPTTGEILVATADSVDDQFGPDGGAVFAQLDGRRNVATIVSTTGLSTFVVCKLLSQMLDAGVIAPVAQADLLSLGAECMTDGRVRDAISLYERAIELSVGLPESHRLAAKAYLAVQDYELAVYHLECDAELRIASGDHAGAAERLLEVRNLLPTDLQARERLVELSLAPGARPIAGFDALAEGKELVELLIEFGDARRVRGLLEKLLLVAPDDVELKKALVNVHIRAGDQKRVVELYESIAEDLAREGKPLEAVGYLQKILLLDRSRGDIAGRVRRFYEFDERSRRRSRAMSVLAGLFALLVVAGSGYWFYDRRAHEAFDAIEVQELLQHEDFAGARAAFEDFLLRFPLTSVAGRAEAELQRIESQRQLFEAKRAAAMAERNRELDRIREEYRGEWTRHRELFLAGKPEEAHTVLARVRDLVARAGAAEDMTWALANNVERTWTSVNDYLTESERLGRDYDTHMQAGNHAQAREVALRLHADFENTAAARRALVPVLVTTRPAGARLVGDGGVLVQERDGVAHELKTPTMVLCTPNASVVLRAELEGFQACRLVVDGRRDATVSGVLEIKPTRVVAFDTPVQTGVGAGDGWLVAGLRGGRLGLVRLDGREQHVRELRGLKAVETTPVVQAGRVFFATNENTVECVNVDPNARVGSWPVRLSAAPATELMVGDGRVALVDAAGVLHCWEQVSGTRVWGVSLDGMASGAPTIDRRMVHVGTVDGRVLLFDAADGRSQGVLRSGAGITTRIHSDGGVLVFGGADGCIRAVDWSAGKVLWSVPVGGVCTDAQLARSGRVVVAAVDGNLVVVDVTTGEVRSRRAVPDAVREVQCTGDRVVVVTRRPKKLNVPAHDVVVAFAADTLEVEWEYALPGFAPGRLGADGRSLALPSSTGEIVLFH
jgi:outer membrane protein assembly factor BamB/tetratricopeptide (TPR) repeat protein